MKKALLLFAALLLSATILSACGNSNSQPTEADTDENAHQEMEITLWTFPVGSWGNPTAVSGLLSAFHKEYPDINVSVEYLSYENGDEKIEKAILDGSTPDLVLEGPERLVANWGDRGLMVDVSDLWESDTAGMIYENVREACQYSNGAYYEIPICMTTHCMAINYDMFQEAGALKYIDEEAHTWSTEDFIQAVSALVDYGQEHVSVVYCKNQSGDQGTRALVNNLYGGHFTDEAHTSYTIDSEENIKALQLLYDLEGITFEPSLSAADTIEMFCNKELAMCFCWNVSMEIQQTINNPGLNFEIFPIAFPTDDGQPDLQGGIWGFGIFDNGDEERIEASKTFIRYMTENNAMYKRTVQTATYWPVRNLDNIYVNDMLMVEYSVFTPYLSDYYQTTPNWAEARAAWWKMLQDIGNGIDVAEAVKDFSNADGISQ